MFVAVGDRSLISPSNPSSEQRIKMNSVLRMIDWDHLHQVADGNTEFELELLQLFIADTQTQIMLLKQAIAVENFSEIEQAAHHIKGASGNVGVTAIQAAANQLEQEVYRLKTMAMKPLVEEIEHTLSQLEAFIKPLLG